MPKYKQRNGFILLLVVAMIPLIGMVVAIVSANSKVLTVKTRQTLLQVRADNACQSGLAWARAQAGRLRQSDTPPPIILLLEDGPVQTTCRLEYVDDPESGAIIEVTGRAESRHFSANCRRVIDLQAF